MSVRDEVRRFVELGPLPAEDDDAGGARIGALEQALHAITAPVSDAEAVLLLATFGADDCFGLAWTVLHLVESARTRLPPADPGAEAGPWVRLLWHRQRG